MKETEILEMATDNLGLLTNGLSIDVYPARAKGRPGYLDIGKGTNKSRLLIELRNEIRHSDLPGIFAKFADGASNWIIISQYIPLPVKNELKKIGINYLEAAGNSFIQTENGVFVYINDQKVTKLRLAIEGKVWRAAGLRLIFTLLNNPERLNTSYRQLAKESGIALGNIGPFIQELKKEGFIEEGRKDGVDILMIKNKEQLLQRWVSLYHTVLRPKLSLGMFRLRDIELAATWKDWDDKGMIWGGENAGALLTGFLHPAQFAIYTKEEKIRLMQQLHLLPDPQGTVEILEQFWPDELQEVLSERKAVPPVIAYAELAASLDSRNRETAERIKAQYLK